jgi:hypothetical protein
MAGIPASVTRAQVSPETDSLKDLLPAGIFVVLVVTDKRLVYVEAAEELQGHPGVLGGDEIGAFESFQTSGRKIVQISDGRAHKI